LNVLRLQQQQFTSNSSYPITYPHNPRHTARI